MEDKGKLVNSVLAKVLGITAPVVWLENNFNEVSDISNIFIERQLVQKARTYFDILLCLTQSLILK